MPDAAAVAAIAALLVAAAVPATAAGAAGDVEVLQEGRGGAPAKPCPDIRHVPQAKLSNGDYNSHAPLVAGGCVLDAQGGADLLVLSVLQRFRFSQCHDVSFKLLVDGRGRGALAGLRFVGTPPCSDAKVCFTLDGRVDRVLGEIRRSPDGRLALRLDMCLDTCIGRFAGELVGDLEREGRGWRLRTPDRLIGGSGWTLDGDWRLTPDPDRIAIRPASR